MSENISIPLSRVEAMAVDVPSLLIQAGLAESVSQANRLIKAGAVQINNCPAEIDLGYPWERVTKRSWFVDPEDFVLRVGRKWKRVSLTR